MVRERLCVVQFIHPGGEHGQDQIGLKAWNLEAHKRKFLRQHGVQVDEAGSPRESELFLWGKWEAESEVEAIEAPISGGPRFIHRPFYSDPPPAGWRQNTDPFVFGDEFHYTGCKQHTARGPTQLRFLRHGSLILFGSCVGRARFVLDTLFVVDDYIDHSRADYERILNGRIPDAYRAATIDPWYSGSGGDQQSYRLYSGATYDSPVNGMFSFFPASTAERDPDGFARPEIRIPGLITSHLTQGQRLNPQPSVREVKQIWTEIVRQVRMVGLTLGVHAGLPTARRASSGRATPRF
jgi:hypothetical protein